MAKREWDQTTARIIKSQWRLINQETQPVVGEYVVEFSYEVNGQTYKGRFRTETEYLVGDTLSLGYDPERPSINDRSFTQWTRIFIGIAGIILAAIIYWFWPSLN